MDESLGELIEGLANRLVAWFDPQRPYAVAFSGGVDSAVVAVAAQRSGANAIAVTARSPSVRQQDMDDAFEVVRHQGLEHRWIETSEIQSADYQRNDSRRCFYCKSHLFAAILEQFPDRLIVSGTNLDDLGDYRPGLEAAQRSAVRAPLAELDIGKQAVRQLARYWQITVADKPASPCLASRIAYGVAVTEERLAMIQAAEIFLYQWMNLRDCRVRLHADDLARIEVEPDALNKVIQPEIRSKILDKFHSLGFRFVTFDLAGQRSGSLNSVLSIRLPQTK